MPLSSSSNDYILVGLAHCFTKQESGVVPVKILEPVPSAYFEALVKGVPTSYKMLYSTRLSALLEENGPTTAHLPAEAQAADFCENFAERAMAAARTYQGKPGIQAKLPCGEIFSEVNFSTEKKRVLNTVHKVTAADNVKQHKYTHMTL